LTEGFLTAVRYANIAVHLPIARHFNYEIPRSLWADCQPGSWVMVPWGRGRKFGVVFDTDVVPEIEIDRIKPILEIIPGSPRLPLSWLKLVEFAATYYHRGLGEVAINNIPKLFRQLDRKSKTSAFDKWRAVDKADAIASKPEQSVKEAAHARRLNQDQTSALAELVSRSDEAKFSTTVLFGVTGSGKTEVYLQWIKHLLATNESGQILMLVPEINLTPALQQHLLTTFPAEEVAIMHSELAEGRRASNWLSAVEGRARLIIGTRLAILTPLPNVRAVLIDEEHDPSFKQQEAPHYSARDLAIAMAQQQAIPIVLASATPSLETWNAIATGRYKCVRLSSRATGAPAPDIQVVHLGAEKTLKHGLTDAAISAIQRSLNRKEQALVFINRRGYAPVIHCSACGWLSQCENCSVCKVLHRKTKALSPQSKTSTGSAYQLICHHCAVVSNPPRQCPSCGNVDLVPLGRGTQKVEEGLAELFPGARIARLDRDAAQKKGVAQKIIADAHAGAIDILVGTQMLAKGHDFQKLSEVIVVDSDSALFSADFRAPERLFATLMQVAGRAGRAKGQKGRVTLQTRFEEHSIFSYLINQDYEGFANQQLEERRASQLPPYSFEALFRLEATTLEIALKQLHQVKSHGHEFMNTHTTFNSKMINICDPIPMAVAKVAGRARAQLLIESASRPALQRLLSAWLPELKTLALRWQIEIDPLEI
jgi:primosomal protein N' (replication factor Y) (superfamily II helicase)